MLALASVLIVDDDDDLRNSLKSLLERAGYDVSTAVNGNEAVRIFRSEPTALIITDIIMPEKEGLETIIELRQEYPEVKIIAISGGGRIGAKGYLQLAQALGANATLTKPFTRTELLESIKEISAQ